MHYRDGDKHESQRIDLPCRYPHFSLLCFKTERSDSHDSFKSFRVVGAQKIFSVGFLAKKLNATLNKTDGGPSLSSFQLLYQFFSRPNPC